MSNYRQMAPAAYLVAALLFFIPFFDALASVAPWHPLAAQWRFGALCFINKSLLIPPPGAAPSAWAALPDFPPKTPPLFRILLLPITAVLRARILPFFPPPPPQP